MYGLSISAAQPVFNIGKLRGHNASVQQLNTSVQMLHEQFDYMPGIVGSMNGVALAVGRTTFELRDKAQKISINMVNAERKLKSFQAELGSSEDAEAREDMEAELKDLSAKVKSQTQDFQSIHKSFGAPYDRNASAGHLIALASELADTEELKSVSEDKLAKLVTEMKSVSDTIDLISKAGIEKIGEEAKLSLDSLRALGLAPPQVQIVLLAIDTLKKLITGIGEAISYLNMLAAYRRLNERALELRAQLQKHGNDMARIVGRIELVNTLDELDDGRSKYASEFANLVGDFELLLLDFSQDIALPVEDRADKAIAKIAEAVAFLKTISR